MESLDQKQNNIVDNNNLIEQIAEAFIDQIVTDGDTEYTSGKNIIKLDMLKIQDFQKLFYTTGNKYMLIKPKYIIDINGNYIPHDILIKIINSSIEYLIKKYTKEEIRFNIPSHLVQHFLRNCGHNVSKKLKHVIKFLDIIYTQEEKRYILWSVNRFGALRGDRYLLSYDDHPKFINEIFSICAKNFNIIEMFYIFMQSLKTQSPEKNDEFYQNFLKTYGAFDDQKIINDIKKTQKMEHIYHPRSLIVQKSDIYSTLSKLLYNSDFKPNRINNYYNDVMNQFK